MISASLSNIVRTTFDSCLKLVRQDCILCGAPSGTALACGACHDELPHHGGLACPVCAGPSDGHVCGSCLKHPPDYERCVAALRYSFPVDELIQALKYRSQLHLSGLLAELLGQAAARAPRPDVLLPMPLHPERARERGFNQAIEIAKPLAQRLGLPVDTSSLVRRRSTAPQATLPLEERHKNVKGAFACGDSLAGKHVALLDDVMTSGATLNEAARTLKRAGAAQVSLWVVARALPHS